ncbi:MAG: hypothetical protein AAFX76_12480, partial [Planctomycetota bacterium]
MAERWVLFVTPAANGRGSAVGWSATLWDTATPGWSAVALPAAESDEELGPWGEAVRDAVEGESVVVALGRGCCMSSSVSAADLPRRGRRQLLMYRMEDRLPLPIESATIGFVDPAAGRQTLGVAIETALLSGMFGVLREAGVGVAAVTPWALLIADAIGAADRKMDADVLAVASSLDGGDDRSIDWLTLDAEGRPVEWITTSGSPTPPEREAARGTAATSRFATLLERRREALGRPVRVVAVGDAGPLALPADCSVARVEQPIRDLMRPALSASVRGKGVAAVRLDRHAEGWGFGGGVGAGRRGAGAWVSSPAVGVALAAVLLLVSGGLWLRAQRYDAVAERARAAQVEAYRSVVGDAGPV